MLNLKNILLISDQREHFTKLKYLLEKEKYKVVISSSQKKEIEKKIYDNFVEIIWFLSDLQGEKIISLCRWLFKKYPNKLYFRWIPDVLKCNITNCEVFRRGECKSALLFFDLGKNLIKRFKFLVQRNYSSILGNLSVELLGILIQVSKKAFLPMVKEDMMAVSDLHSQIDLAINYLNKEIGEKIVKKLKEIFFADKVSLFNYDIEKNNYILIASYGFLKDQEEPIVMDRKWQLMQKVISTHKPLLIQNGMIHYPEIKKLKIKPQPEVISSMIFPLITISKKEVIGVLNIARISPKKERFTNYEFLIAQYLVHWITLIYSIILGFKLSLEYAKLKSDFVSIINHELRTPLMSILASLEFISGKIPQQIYSILSRNVTRMRDLIEELLDFTRISKGKLSVVEEKNSISSLIEEVIEEYNSLAELKNIKIIVEKDIHTDLCFFDKNRMKQVLVNLITNSIKFMPDEKENKYIKISVKERADEYVFSVEDNGIGIKKKDLQKIFFPFVQIGSVMTDHKPGLGVGLFICRAIIKSHKGKIWVESEYGQFMKVNFTIPKKEKVVTTQDIDNKNSFDKNQEDI